MENSGHKIVVYSTVYTQLHEARGWPTRRIHKSAQRYSICQMNRMYLYSYLCPYVFIIIVDEVRPQGDVQASNSLRHVVVRVVCCYKYDCCMQYDSAIALH